jgi:transposase InsO family protein
MVIGRDQCYNVLRANGFALRRKNFRPRTTNSNHNFYIYSDLLNVTPKLRPSGNGELVVTDITYVATNKGWAYLSLATDAFSRAIIGYAIRPTLDTSGPMKALHMAYDFYKKNGIDTGRLIHHSDRGIQYCSNQYVNDLKEHGVRISMTQCGDPLHNALAERMNNTIKNGWLFGSEDESIDVVAKKIEHAVNAYNNFRPHQALNMHTPMEVVNGSYLLSAS